jgi:hypothetical protein
LSAAEFCKQHELCDKYFSLRKNQKRFQHLKRKQACNVV